MPFLRFGTKLAIDGLSAPYSRICLLNLSLMEAGKELCMMVCILVLEYERILLEDFILLVVWTAVGFLDDLAWSQA